MISKLLRNFLGKKEDVVPSSAATSLETQERPQPELGDDEVDELIEMAMAHAGEKPPDYAQAARWFGEAWKARPDDMDIRLNLAEALFHTRGAPVEDTMCHFEALAAGARAPSQRAFHHFRLGQCCFELHRFDEAAVWFEKVPADDRLKPQAEAAALHCGMAKRAKAEEAPGRKEIRKLLALMEQQAEALQKSATLNSKQSRKLAKLLVECGCLHAKLVQPGGQSPLHWDRALGCFRAALEVQKDCAQAFYCEGLLWACAPHLEAPGESETMRAQSLLKLALELDWGTGLRRGQYPFEPETEARFLHLADVFQKMDFPYKEEEYVDKSICAAKKIKAEDNHYMQRAKKAHPGGLVSPGNKPLLLALHSYIKLSGLDRNRADFAPRYFLRRGEIHELLEREALAYADYQHAQVRADATDEAALHQPLSRGEIQACRDGMSRMAKKAKAKQAGRPAAEPVPSRLQEAGCISPAGLAAELTQAVIFRDTLDGSASGVFISPDGLILTCAHGLAALSLPSVSYFHRLACGRLESLELEAEVLKVDHEHDLALLKVKPQPVPFLFFALAKSSAPPGTRVLHCGHPARNVINSALSESLSAFFQESRGNVLSNEATTFHSNACIFPGFSGGPAIEPGSALLIGITLASNSGGKHAISANLKTLRKFLKP